MSSYIKRHVTSPCVVVFILILHVHVYEQYCIQ